MHLYLIICLFIDKNIMSNSHLLKMRNFLSYYNVHKITQIFTFRDKHQKAQMIQYKGQISRFLLEGASISHT